ncbi:MAG: hypothetical protein HOA02_06025, partial [Planctomycetes bacterium]|nr:hypothetical protein [Planctomycetota bacterium]
MAGDASEAGNEPNSDSSREPEQIRREGFQQLGISTPDRAMWNLRSVLREIGEDQEARIFLALQQAS